MLAYFCLVGKQYAAKNGDILIGCPHISGMIGDTVYSDEVLGVDGVIGDPFLKGARVELKIVKQGKSKKLKIVNFKPQKRHEKWKGFRRCYTNLEVVKVHWSK